MTAGKVSTHGSAQIVRFSRPAPAARGVQWVRGGTAGARGPCHPFRFPTGGGAPVPVPPARAAAGIDTPLRVPEHEGGRFIAPPGMATGRAVHPASRT